MPSVRSKKRGHKTPLEREYERLTHWYLQEDASEDGPLHELVAERSYRADDLLIWRHEIRGQTEFSREKAVRRAAGKRSRLKWELNYRNACYPSQVNRPSPALTPNLVVAACFSPGRIVALDRLTGVKQWSLDLNYFAQPPPLYFDGTVYGGTCQELYSIEAESGEIRWRFCPYGTVGDWMYSSPTIAEGRLFIGDRNGCFHCLNLLTGDWNWWQRPSRARNNNINSTAVIVGDRVVVATNSAWVLCYDQQTGEEIWRTRIDGSSIHQMLRYGESVVAATMKSVYVIDPSTGRIDGRVRWRHFEIQGVEVAEDILLVVRRRVMPGGNSWPVEELIALRGDHGLYRLTYPIHCGPSLLYSAGTRSVYEATPKGLGILDPGTGVRSSAITDFSSAVKHGHEFGDHQVNRPAVADGQLYVLSRNADVLALRHPQRGTRA